MPHTIIEHSFAISKTQLDSMMLTINQNIAKNEGNFDISQCKARSVFCENFVVGEGAYSQDFMHITIKIMSGRTLEVKQNLAANLFKIVSNFLTQNNLSNSQTALSLDIVDIVRETYQKTVISLNL